MELNKNQIKAIEYFEGNCCVLASAGSGKTTVLVNRIVNLIKVHNVSPNNILAITFSKKAKENMKNKLNNLLGNISNQITIETFHALGYKILKESRYNFYYDVINSWQQKQIINNIIIKELGLEDNDLDIETNEILGFISYQKNNLVDCNDKLIPIRNIPYGMDFMKTIYKKYEYYKQQDKKIDYDDMLLNTYKLLSNNDIERTKYQNRFKFILVDEMQDTNKAQYEILRLLGKTNNNVFVVGDPLQNIYEWRMSNNNYLIDFYKDWVDTEVVPLNINYRSSRNIVELSNKLVKNTKETTHKYYYESKSNKPKYKEPEFNCFKDELEEADFISKKIIEFKKSDKCFSDIAILIRTNFQSKSIETELYKNNIAYEIVDGKSFYENKEIQDMISYLRLVNNTNDDESFKRIYNTPNRYLGTVFLNEVTAFSQKYKMSLFDSMFSFPRSDEWRYKNGIQELNHIVTKIQKRKRYKVGDLIEIIRNELDYDKFISKENYENNDKNEKIENLDTLVTTANEYKSISSFLEDVDKILNYTKINNSTDKVKILTIHKSKGLEFPIVFIAGVNNLLLPHAKSSNENEERRLFYVAMTRAEKELFISSTRMYNGRAMDISEFIYDIFDEKYINQQIH